MAQHDSENPSGTTTPVDSQQQTSLLITKEWVKKYFWEGQKLTEKAQEISPDAPWYIKHRRLLSMLAPAILFHIGWWSYMGRTNQFYLFNDKAGEGEVPRWYMTVTMLFGSMIAGATSEGGASVAFPVMTLAFGIAPTIARDFSFMIQSFGMTAAGFTILTMRVKIEYHALLYTSLGGVIGIILGLEYVAPSLTPPYSKMYFVVIWFAFAFSLYQLNLLHGRKVYMEVPHWSKGVLFRAGHFCFNWKAFALFCFGILGGIFSAMSGSGIDICSFACLTLLFRVSEKVATPTSVLLMAGNTCIGFLYRHYGMGGAEPEAFKYLLVCIPIVVLGAPMGSVIGSHFHRLVLASFVYITDTVQLIGALAIVRPWSTLKTDTPLHLSLTSLVIVISGGIFFRLLAYAGERLMESQEKNTYGHR
mmetsp:Transcript_26/g.31  ORF Transcript_26/g.31 Transcript_26/m.31 type:complete len:418 (+) Transcript_26:135-1388(+)